MENTSNIVTNSPTKGLVTDLHENMIGKEIWSHARNAQMNSHLGQLLFLQNEPSNRHCVNLPYTPIGFIQLLNKRWAIFTTDDVNSEIGIFDEKDCSYTKLVNAPCLGFKKTNNIIGIAKENEDCSESIYWTDNLSPRRKLNLSYIPYTYTTKDDACETKEFTDELDCTELLVESKITVPTITPRESSSGNLRNGVYQFAIAYSSGQSRVTEFYSVSKPLRLFTHENSGKSIQLTIDNLDRDYDEYELFVIYTKDESPAYKSLGFYSTATSNVLVSNVDRPEYVVSSLNEVLAKRPRYPYAATVASNDEFALWANLKMKPELNYQLQAMDINAEYVVFRVPENYYAEAGIEVGYERDEVYAFGIQWLYDDGSWSPVYHIPGREADANEQGLASGKDVYEYLIQDPTCPVEQVIKVWEVENTAGVQQSINSTAICDEKIVARGTLGYWESTNLYPDNETLFGDARCTPIRHHKMPDTSKAPHHTEDGRYINILGVRFDNIERPKNSDGSYNTEVVGFKIVRGDRKNDRSIIAKGLVSNVRSYNETDGREVFYSNYPYNDLRSDSFISSRQTKGKAGGEREFQALTGFKDDRFNFHGPHPLFSNVSLGEELAIYHEEIANVSGKFEEVYKHPKQKLLTQFDLYFALILGALDGYYAQQGKKCTTIVDNHTISLGSIQTPGGPTPPQTVIVNRTKQDQACDDALAFTSTLTVNNRQVRAAERILRTLARVGIFAYFTLQTAQKVLDIVSNFNPWQQYAIQYNSKADFNQIIPVEKDNRRRSIQYYQYIRDGINTVEGTSFNNYKRETSVFLRTNQEIKVPDTLDNSRKTLSEFGICNDRFREVNSTASMFYTGIKRKVPNQYGSLDGIRYYDTGYTNVNLVSTNPPTVRTITYRTENVFGGDTFINRFAIKRSHHYFSQFLADVPDGFILDYRNYRNVGYPRFWMDSTPYDLSGFISLTPNLNRTPANKHNLDCGSDTRNGISVVKNRYFYLFNSGVMNFFVESDYNIDARDWKYDEPTFYSRNNGDISNLFRSDKIQLHEEFIYDNTYSKELTENVILAQRTDFDPVVNETCETQVKNRVIYSNSGDWDTYLALNYHDFPQTDFGNLVAMKQIDNQQIMFLFDKSSPYISAGRDELQLDGSGRKITIGDAGLFSQDPRPITYTDTYYGNTNSKWAFNVTQFGIFYPSQTQGRIFRYTGKMDEITKNGMGFWFKNYLPSKLLEDFPTFKHSDNPVAGVAVQSVFDNKDEIYYITKKDYALKADYRGVITYDADRDVFLIGTRIVDLSDTRYFEDASWTVSFDPKTNSFISFHDWHPDWTLQSETKFFTIKNNAIWKHNDRYDSFCNFYNIDYPFEIEYVVNNGQNVEILRSLEYFLDAGKYFNNGRDFHQLLDDNFDEAIVSNNEQCSGLMKLILQNKKDLTQLFGFPRFDSANDLVKVLYNKEEQKYRIDQFTDIIRDRGEFTHRNIPIWNTEINGYKKSINQFAIDYTKPVQQQKKFRSLWHKVFLRKLISKDIKYIFKFANAKEVISFR
jgi:hypothetical protein